MSPIRDPAKYKKPSITLASIFWALVAVFISIGIITTVLYYFIPFRAYGKFIFPSILAVLLILSIVLLVIAVKEKVGGILGKFLILTGASAIGIAVGIILENFLTGTVGESIFFIIGVMIAPIGFLVGVIGSMVLFVKRRKAA